MSAQGIGCSELRDLIHPFLDGELDVDRNVEILKHFELCPPCNERKEAESKLQATIAAAATESLDEVTRARLLGAALNSAPPSRSTPWIAAAAALLVSLGVATFYSLDPFCVWGCQTQQQMESVYLQSRFAPAVTPIAKEFKPPTCPGSKFNADGTCQLVTPASNCAEIPLWKISSKSGRQFGYVRLPGAHAHDQKVHKDGRRFFEGAFADGTRYVGWKDPRGGVSACVSPEGGSSDELYVLATSIRNSEL